MTQPTRLAEREVVERRLIMEDEWKQFQESLNENHKTVEDSLAKLYNLVEAEEVDGVCLRISKISVLKDITNAMNSTMEACEFTLKHYILSESQKIQIDEHMRRFEENLVWFI